MYYFRDCYFDQQVAFGVSRASIRPARRPSRRERKNRYAPSRGSVLGLFAPFVSVGVTFCFGLMVMDVLGMEHLVIVPSVEGVKPVFEHACVLVSDLVDMLPDMPIG